MKKSLVSLFTVLLSCLSLGAQPLATTLPYHGRHHTQRLPGVGEHRLERLQKMREANIALRHRQGPWRAQTQPQTKKGLVLLAEFSDVKFKKGAATDWYNRFNQQGFSLDSHVGSVRDYFIEQSYGQLTIDFDVIGPLQLSYNHDYYGTPPNDRLDDRAAEMVIEALKLADPEVNYADYDWNGDGEVDQIYVIYAGKTSSTEPGYIWPHEWYLANAKHYGNGSGAQSLDGVNVDTYAVSNELADDDIVEGIGTACHEFSHCLGFPDFYDPDYTGGTGGQYWDLLDGGEYNGPGYIGEIPSPYTAYERWAAGWIDLIPLTVPGRVKDLPAINSEGVAYIIKNTGNSNEYYILENRQQMTFGMGNRGHGLMVWHIDYNQNAWASNSVNKDDDHQRMTFLPADGQVGVLEDYGYGYLYYVTPDDEAGDPYPGKQRVNEVQPLTWFTAEKYGTKTHANLIHNISESAEGLISFTYGDYHPLPMPELTSPTDITLNGFTANWQAVAGATSYNLQVKTTMGIPCPATLLAENFSGFSDLNDGSLITGSVLNKYTQVPGWTGRALYGTKDAAVRISSANNVGNLTTPVIENQPGTLFVEFDAAYYNRDGSSVIVTVYSADDTETIASQEVQLTDTRATYSLTFEDVPAGCKVEFASTNRSKRIILYNINIMDMSGMDNTVTTYTGLTTTTYNVEFTDAVRCYYRVRAVCDDGTSEWSEWMEVDIASGIEEISADDMSEGQIVNGKWSNGKLYDLSGRCLQSVPQRGFYIRGGKTYLSR